jgi:hypothetical protein
LNRTTSSALPKPAKGRQTLFQALIIPHCASGCTSRDIYPLIKIKPALPKEALRVALRTVRKAFSSSLYQQIASKVSFERCVDDSFLKLKYILQQWFSAVIEE